MQQHSPGRAVYEEGTQSSLSSQKLFLPKKASAVSACSAFPLFNQGAIFLMSAEFKLSRRDLLLSLPALSVARAVFAQSGTRFKIRALNHMTIRVADPKRTIEFYQ